jgi:hypothetical protein
MEGEKILAPTATATVTKIVATTTTAVTTAAVTAATRTIATAATVATATAVTTATTAATTESTATTLFTGASFIDTQGTAVNLIPIQRLNGGQSIGISHFHKTKATKTAGVTIIDHCYGFHGAMLFKHIAYVFFRRLKRQISYINFL